VTRDRHFGSLIFVRALTQGVVYLRMLPSMTSSVHAELARVPEDYPEDQLRKVFITVEPGRHRVRRITAKAGQNGR